MVDFAGGGSDIPRLSARRTTTHVFLILDRDHLAHAVQRRSVGRMGLGMDRRIALKRSGSFAVKILPITDLYLSMTLELSLRKA